MSNYYFTYEDLGGKYPAAIKDHQEPLVNSVWIPAAQGEVDAYLGSQFVVPFNPCPAIVKDLAIDVCYYKMNFAADFAKPLKEYINQRFKDILEGRMVSLANSGQGDPVQQAVVFLTTSGSASSFGMDRTEDFRVDSGWQQQYASDRGDVVI